MASSEQNNAGRFTVELFKSERGKPCKNNFTQRRNYSKDGELKGTKEWRRLFFFSCSSALRTRIFSFFTVLQRFRFTFWNRGIRPYSKNSKRLRKNSYGEKLFENYNIFWRIFKSRWHHQGEFNRNIFTSEQWASMKR